MTNKINITINNKKLLVNKNLTVLQACSEFGYEIPRFCYHNQLSVAGNCRMCLVEVEKVPKPVVACAMPIAENMVIYTDTPLVKKAREAVLEFLLINHPLDCPICDQGGECDLQDQSFQYGSDFSRYYEFKRGVEDKECGPIIKTIMTRCIHCTRCVRFLAEYANTEELGLINRGEKTEIGVYLNKFIKTELSGNLIDLCPVGALTSKPFAFKARSWELEKIETTDFFDASGSNIVVHTRINSDKKKTNINTIDKIMRILPKKNMDINEEWISDKTRFAFDGLYNQRLVEPYVLKKNVLNTTNWKTILNSSFLLKKNKNIKTFFGKNTDVETIYYMFQFLNYLSSNNIQYDEDLLNINIDIPIFYRFNSLLKNIKDVDLVLLIGTNPRFESSSLNIKLKKLTKKRKVKIFSIGNQNNLTYNYNHIGSTTKTLLEIAEGKHKICRDLCKAKNPIIIVGTSVLKRKDALTIKNLLFTIVKNSCLITKNYNGFNTLNAFVGSINSFELGVYPGTNSSLFYKKYNKNDISDVVFLNEINLKNLNYYTYNNNNYDKTYTYIQNTHYTKNFKKADFVFPSLTLFEKSNSIYNIEGNLKQTNKVVSNNSLARNNFRLFQILGKYNKMNILNSVKNFDDYLVNPSSWYKKNNIDNNFVIKIISKFEQNTRLYLSPFKPLLSNFYMTDDISQNSSVMGECTVLLQKNTNYK